jgi:hypothetical protein
MTLIRQKRGETEMKNYQVNVILHLSGNLGAAERAGIAQQIAAQPGVSRAQPSPKAERLLLVDYDPSAISSQRILGSVRSRGVAAQLVGL